MASICSWCGEKVSLFDTDYTYKKVSDELHCICGKCSKKVSAAQNGDLTFEEIKTDKTIPELFIRISKNVTPVTDTTENAEEIMQEQSLSGNEKTCKADRMYDDIHQISKDLRFIKNYLIFCIVTSGIVVFLWFVIWLLNKSS